MRVLCTCSPTYGHFHPMVALGQALQARGHEVAFATSREFCVRVEKAGFRSFPAGIALARRTELIAGLLAELERLPPAERAGFGFARAFAEVGAPAMLPDLLDLLPSYRPDLLIHETSELAGPIAATKLGVVHVNHSYGHLLPRAVLARTAPALEPLWREQGLEMPPDAGLYGHAYLDICPPSIQFPEIDELASVQRLRPVTFDAAEGESLPGWADHLGGLPVVYVTMGTVFNRASSLFQKLLEGLSSEPIELIVTLGTGGDPSAFGAVAPNVHIERYIPQTLLLPRCSLVVSHGGSGTMFGALGAGLPMLVIPQGADQFRNAERCANAGVARTLLPHEVSPRAIRDEVRLLLDDPQYRARAAALRAELEAMPAPEEVASALERFATGREQN